MGSVWQNVWSWLIQLHWCLHKLGSIVFWVSYSNPNISLWLLFILLHKKEYICRLHAEKSWGDVSKREWWKLKRFPGIFFSSLIELQGRYQDIWQQRENGNRYGRLYEWTPQGGRNGMTGSKKRESYFLLTHGYTVW